MKSRKGMVSPKYDVGWVWEGLMDRLAVKANQRK
jgi:hypothetical protein